eukprot:1363968-Rhodomonas_salina.1
MDEEKQKLSRKKGKQGKGGERLRIRRKKKVRRVLCPELVPSVVCKTDIIHSEHPVCATQSLSGTDVGCAALRLSRGTRRWRECGRGGAR